MSIKYHDVNVGVTLGGGGGGSTIVSKTITANGTYNASADSADGYNPVTVSVGADPRTLLASWDFTGQTPLVDSVGGKTLTNYNNAVAFSSAGAFFSANSNTSQGLGQHQSLSISLTDLLGSGASIAGCDIEVDVGSWGRYTKGTSNAVRFIMVTSGNGFAYRQTSSTSTSGWGFYQGAWGSEVIISSSIEYSTTKLSIAADSTENDQVYINGILVLESNLASLSTVATDVILGRSDGTCIGGIYLTGMRIYRRPA